MAAAEETLYTYDLTHLLRRDLSDPAIRRTVWDELQLVASVQGIVNRLKPRLYVFLVGRRGSTDRFWLDQLRTPGAWLADRKLVPIRTPEALIATFRPAIRGAVVWDEAVPATSNVAATAAGVERAVVLRHDTAPGSLYDRLILSARGPELPVVLRLYQADGEPLFTGRGTIPGTDLPSTGSAKCDAYLWAVERYLKPGRCNPTVLGYYPDAWWLQHPGDVPAERTLLSNHDFLIARHGFLFDLTPWDDETPEDDPHQPLGADARTLREILRAAYTAARGKMIHVCGFPPWDQKYTDHTRGKHGGVATEWRYAEILSCFNAYMDADAAGLHAMANASLYQHYPLAPSYPQKHLPTERDLMHQGYVVQTGTGLEVAPKPYVAFYVGDYDSAAWLYQTLPEFWNDPARGTVPLGWAFNPVLQERFPVGLAWARRTATPNDYFIAGDSGAGYLNPGYLVPPRKWSGLPSGLPAWEAFNAALYRKWGLCLTGFIIDGNAPPMSREVLEAYARFSPCGVVAQKIPPMSLVRGVPFLRMGPDLTGTSEQGADTIAAQTPSNAPSFAIYRTILWSPSGHKALVDRLHQIRPDIQVVDPHTLLLLVKTYLQSHAGGK